MIKTSAAYKIANTADARQMNVQAIVGIISPDIVYRAGIHSPEEQDLSHISQIWDKEMELSANYITLEANRWILDGSARAIPDEPEKLEGQTGYVSESLSGPDGTFTTEQYVELDFTNVRILQACSVYFPYAYIDGVPADFTVSIMVGGTVGHTETFTDNVAEHVSLTGFKVRKPTGIRVNVTRWSLPGRRMRVAEIIPGVYEKWTGDDIVSVRVQQKMGLALTSVPYSTADITFVNQDRRFDPRNKSGIFESIEERQSMTIFMGPTLADGTKELVQIGVYFQYAFGWRTGNNALTIKWTLADILGLLSGRAFPLNLPYPTTLEGWISAAVSTLGDNFAGMYRIEDGYANKPVIMNEPGENEKYVYTCIEIIKFACMATGTFPHADPQTGYLRIDSLQDKGNEITLDNMNNYPVIGFNSTLGEIKFGLFNGTDENEYTVPGPYPSGESVPVNNPFVHTTEQADAVAAIIKAAYGGNIIDVTYRGDPSSEVGDLCPVWLDETGPVQCRLMEQNLSITNGVLKDCKSKFLTYGLFQDGKEAG